MMPGLTYADLAALAWFALCAGGYSFATRHGLLAAKGMVRAINQQRARWMANMAARENRMVDVQILATLSRGNAFFASTAIFVTGALAALFGNAEDLHTLANKVPFLRKTTLFMWQFKIIFLMGVFVMAFFKFAWAFRLSHYTAIMIGATPIASSKNREECESHAVNVATLASLVGYHANAGLRAYYYGIAALGWFIHPAVFMLAMLWITAVLYRREYHSRAYKAISAGTL
ncbi:MAG: DUF599 domain-containing protein [Methyloligellaceae bacterium]